MKEWFEAIRISLIRISFLEHTQTTQGAYVLSQAAFTVIRKAKLPLKLDFEPDHPSWWSSCSNIDFDTNLDTATEDSSEQIQEFHSKLEEQAELERRVVSSTAEAGLAWLAGAGCAGA